MARTCPVTELECSGQFCHVGAAQCWRQWERERLEYGNDFFAGWAPVRFKPLTEVPNWGDA